LYSYTAYGLGLHSVLALPELVAADAAPDVVIRLGEVERTPEEAEKPGACFRATAGEVGLFWEGVGVFLVREGAEIVVDPAPGVEERVLRLFILGPSLGVLLHQRGFLILHASAVVVNGAAVAFVGGSGWGKSTTAAALHKRGHGIVADDVVAVFVDDEVDPIVFPGFPQLKLWPEAAESLGEVPEMMPRLHPLGEKRARRDARGFPQASLPLTCIYVLAEGEAQEIEDLHSQEAFVEIVRHSYVVRLLEATGARTLHFNQCAMLVRRVPIRRLKTHRSLAALPDLAKLVEEDVARG
jgi:hypothetical protein